MTEADRARIERLRTPAVNPCVSYDGFYLPFYRRYAENGKLTAPETRYADALAFAFSEAPVEIAEGELIVGRTGTLDADAQSEWKKLSESALVRDAVTRDGQDSHMAVDYPLLLKEGIRGVIARIRTLREGACESKRVWYDSCVTALEAVSAFSKRYARRALELSRAAEDEETAQELEEISRICASVPENPARTFHEAVQSVHFLTFCLSVAPLRLNHQQFQLGRPDRYLLPYYEADIAAGRIARDRAQLLLDCLAIQINMRVPRGLSSGYMLGGCLADGTVVDNPLTAMGMQVIDDIRLVYPSVGLCCSSGTPESTLSAACEILSHGRSHPAIFNDDVISAGLINYGVPAQDAHEYIHSTCVEITPVAASNVWVASPYTNMPQLLLDCMDGEYADFDALMQAVYARLDASIRRNFEEQNEYRKLRAEKSVNPLLSCFVNDCLAEGTDIERGGARYNWIMPSFVGMANLADSLCAVRGAVFEEGRLTLAQLKQALDSDFEGCEALRLSLENRYPKYGNNDDTADGCFTDIVMHIIRECAKYTPVMSNARLIPSVFCWVMHEYFGTRTGATPDGRKRGFPLGDGSGACQGREKHGPTAAVLSCTKWPHAPMTGGVAMNMKFPKKTFTSRSMKNVETLIRVYLARGGFETQINVVDRETLLRAQAHPADYRDLVVRIGGYSDYFVNLSPEMQAEVLLRTEHEI